MRLFQEVAQRAQSQLGNLGGLAAGDLTAFGPTGQDQQLISRSLGFQTDIARRALESLSAEGQSRLGEELSSRGQSDSSFESVRRAILERDLGRSVEDMISKQSMAGNEALMNLPFQRANVALGANQALFQQLTGAGTPALQSMLNARMAQPTTTQSQSGMDFGQLAQLGMSGAGLFAGMPPGLGGLAGLFGGGQPNVPSGLPPQYSNPSLYGGFQSGLLQGRGK